MDRIKRLYEFQCKKTGERWYRETEETVCPIKRDCCEEVKQIGYLIVEVVHSAVIKEEGGEGFYSKNRRAIA
jgi:hypothetical protein